MSDIGRPPPGRMERLKACTSALHRDLDARLIDVLRPSDSRERYGRFLRVQHAFHARIEGLYRDSAVAAVVPDIGERSRLARIVADHRDLRLPVRALDAGAFARLAFPEGLGWLYVAEGSKLGGAFLLKEARRLGLGSRFGARHLTPPAEGLGLQWRCFGGYLDRIELNAIESSRVEQGAQAAFAHFRDLLELPPLRYRRLPEDR